MKGRIPKIADREEMSFDKLKEIVKYGLTTVEKTVSHTLASLDTPLLTATRVIFHIVSVHFSAEMDIFGELFVAEALLTLQHGLLQLDVVKFVAFCDNLVLVLGVSSRVILVERANQVIETADGGSLLSDTLFVAYWGHALLDKAGSDVNERCAKFLGIHLLVSLLEGGTLLND